LQRTLSFAVLAPGGQSGYFWIRPRIHCGWGFNADDSKWLCEKGGKVVSTTRINYRFHFSVVIAQRICSVTFPNI